MPPPIQQNKKVPGKENPSKQVDPSNTSPEKMQKTPSKEDLPDMKQAKAAGPKEPKVPQDDMFKFEMKYMNGGFNNGVRIKPDKGGKALVEIKIYGGGEKKSMSIGPLPANIQKLVKAYEIQATDGEDSPEITDELKKYFKNLSDNLSIEAISILQEADNKMLAAIKKVFKTTK